MKYIVEISYFLIVPLILANMFLCIDYGTGESMLLGSLFMPGAFILKVLLPQLDFSERKKGITDCFFLFSSVIIFTFLLIAVTHMTVISPGDFQSILLNPFFSALILVSVAFGDKYLIIALEKLFPERQESISFVSDRRKVSIAVSEIVFVESNDRDVYIHTSDGTAYRNKTPISAWENVLSPGFLRVHRAFLVNRDYIGDISPESVSVQERTIPVSRKYRDRVREEFQMSRPNV